MQLKPYDHTKNSQMNSPYLSLLKKDLQTSIKINDTNVNIARLTEFGKIKHKPSNNRKFYYLIDDNTDITDSQTPIITKTNTPILEKK